MSPDTYPTGVEMRSSYTESATTARSHPSRLASES